MLAFSLSTYLCVHTCPCLLSYACFLHFNMSLRQSLCRAVHVEFAYCIHVSPCMCIFKWNIYIQYVLICILCVLLLAWSSCDFFICQLFVFVFMYVCFWWAVCVCVWPHSSIRPHSGALSHFKCPARSMWNCRKRLSTCRVWRRLCRLDLNGSSSLNEKQLCRKEGLACWKGEHWFH